MFESVGLLDVSVCLSLQEMSFALGSRFVRFLLSLEDRQQFNSGLDTGDSSNLSFDSLNVPSSDSNSQRNDLRLSSVASVEFDLGQTDLSQESESGGSLGLLLSLS